MKRYRIYFIILLSFCSFFCKKDFLDVSDRSVVLRQDYVVDLKTTGDFLNGVYVKLGWEFYHGYNQIYPELVADNIRPVASGTDLSIHYNWTQAPEVSGANMNSMWGQGYQIARSCSFVLEKAEEYKGQDADIANSFMGQAYAIRALTHFMLANIFSQSYAFTGDGSHPGIPYVTTSDWTQPVGGRKTVKEVYNSLISDLNNAIQLLPVNSSSSLLFSRDAAKALLARVYLFKGDYLAAKTLACQVSIAVPIMTNDYPQKLFTLQETEALFQLPPDATTYLTLFSGIYFSPSVSLQFVATKDVASILMENSNDKRIIWVRGNSGDWHITKFTDSVVASYPYPAGSYYQTIIRSSEMYLTAAESYARLSMEDSARFFLDEIRRRADITAVNSTATGQALLDSIYKERRKELAFEGLRMFDLQRWKKEVRRIDVLNSAPKTLPYPSDKAVAPLPIQDVKISGLSQNPGY